MKPPALGYLRTESTQHTLETLAHAGEDARVLAGGQPLTAALNMRPAQSQLPVDTSHMHDPNAVRVEDGYLEVSAAATQGNVEWRPSLANEVPLLALVFPYISHLQIRNCSMVCGSIAHAGPSAELPLVFTALDGQVVLRSLRRRRMMQTTDFLQGMLMTAREPDKLVEAARSPLWQPNVCYGFTEFSARHGDFVLMACAAIVTDNATAPAVGGVADQLALECWLRLQGKALTEAINDFSWKLGAQDDAHVSAQYRRHLVRQLGMCATEEVK